MKLFQHFKEIHLRLVYLTDGFDVLEFSTKLVDEDFVRLDIHIFKDASALIFHVLPFCIALCFLVLFSGHSCLVVEQLEGLLLGGSWAHLPADWIDCWVEGWVALVVSVLLRELTVPRHIGV